MFGSSSSKKELKVPPNKPPRIPHHKQPLAPQPTTQAVNPSLAPSTQVKQESLLVKTKDMLQLLWGKGAAIYLTFHSVVGLWESIQFIFYEYPDLEQKLNVGLISPEEIRQVSATAILVMFSTAITTIFAIRLTKSRENFQELLEIIVATLFLIFNHKIQHFLLGFDWSRIWIQYFS